MSDQEAALPLLNTEYQNLRQAFDGLDADQLSRVWRQVHMNLHQGGEGSA